MISFTSEPLMPREKVPHNNPLDRRPGEPQSQPVPCGEKESVFSFWWLNPNHPTFSLVTVLNKLCQPPFLAYLPDFEKISRLTGSPCSLCFFMGIPYIIARQCLNKHIPAAMNTRVLCRVKYSVCSERKAGD